VAGKQRGRRVHSKPSKPQNAQARGGKHRVMIAGSEDDGDPLSIQPPGREHKGVGRGPVQPVRVVDEARERTVLGEFC
jgi:hypothetical protein